ncbi:MULTISPECIES: Txe/YoeB family addiction module toxin [Sedimentibacter]|uniref:Endoribonuclease YoeB n=1 Tax=Sedimentibacter hydroxybenzoicus DSM 7310 TaxID=1123245 RepID=A0A974GUW6_SEDHY|nr:MULTISPECIES: Txe/YoeB family addiction module toxin [Sedimentibacter]NYB72669.1 Txe/YoeB family addiction module toxin [Sedimentibacter hydroxybenzoicus DSM 7310]
MSKLIFTERAWEEYLYWQTQDKKTLKRINALLKDIDRNNFDGLGKPELLKNFEGSWSRRIDEVNRLVYKVSNGRIEIIQCKGHYDD